MPENQLVKETTKSIEIVASQAIEITERIGIDRMDCKESSCLIFLVDGTAIEIETNAIYEELRYTYKIYPGTPRHH